MINQVKYMSTVMSFLFLLLNVHLCVHVYCIIKCSEKCACRDLSERAQYISILKHVPYTTRVHSRDIMQAAYIISMSAHRQFTIQCTFYKRNKKLVPRTLLSYISTWDFLRTLENCEKHSPAAHAYLALLPCS